MSEINRRKAEHFEGGKKSIKKGIAHEKLQWSRVEKFERREWKRKPENVDGREVSQNKRGRLAGGEKEKR